VRQEVAPTCAKIVDGSIDRKIDTDDLADPMTQGVPIGSVVLYRGSFRRASALASKRRQRALAKATGRRDQGHAQDQHHQPDQSTDTAHR
jgi:hypothetical protein